MNPTPRCEIETLGKRWREANLGNGERRRTLNKRSIPAASPTAISYLHYPLQILLVYRWAWLDVERTDVRWWWVLRIAATWWKTGSGGKAKGCRSTFHHDRRAASAGALVVRDDGPMPTVSCVGGCVGGGGDGVVCSLNVPSVVTSQVVEVGERLGERPRLDASDGRPVRRVFRWCWTEEGAALVARCGR